MATYIANAATTAAETCALERPQASHIVWGERFAATRGAAVLVELVAALDSTTKLYLEARPAHLRASDSPANADALAQHFARIDAALASYISVLRWDRAGLVRIETRTAAQARSAASAGSVPQSGGPVVTAPAAGARNAAASAARRRS